MDQYQAKSFDHLLGTEGFSDKLLKDHFTLYQGYVTNTNKLVQQMTELWDQNKADTPQFAEFKRRFGWEFNGMRLHELYFGNMKKGGSKLDEESDLAGAIREEFGNFAGWEKSFRAVAAMRGIGWAVLYYDPIGERLFNCWVNEHDAGHLASCAPVLILDAFEHAYMTDYGIKRAGYIDAFMKAIDWESAVNRYSRIFMGKTVEMIQQR